MNVSLSNSSTPAEFVTELDSTEKRFSGETGLTSNWLKKLANAIEAADWLNTNSSILSRVSRSVESVMEDMTDSFILFSPLLQIAVFFKELNLNHEFSIQIEKLQAQKYEAKRLALSDEQQTPSTEVCTKIQQLQLQILKKSLSLKVKLYKTSIKLLYFTNRVCLATKVFNKQIANSAFKVLAVSLKESYTVYSVFTALTKQHEQMFSLSAPVITNSSLQDSESFIQHLEACETTEAVKKEMSSLGIQLFVPENIHQFRDLLSTPQYRRILKEKHEYSLHHKSSIEQFTQRTLAHQSTTSRQTTAQTVLDTFKCQQQDFKRRLQLLKPKIANQHPEITDESAIESLARTELTRIDAEASMLKLAITQTMVVKHQVERPFYYYAIMQSFQKLSLSGAKLAGSCLAVGGQTALQGFVKLFSGDLLESLPTAHLVSFFSFLPLVSQISFKIFNVLIDFSKIGFARQYKPNEYSLKGYQHTFLLEKFKLQKIAYQTYHAAHKGFLHVKAYLGRLNNEDLELSLNGLEANEVAFVGELKKQSSTSENMLKTLKTQDLDFALGIKPMIKKGVLTDTQVATGIDVITDTLKKAELQYYPAETLEFLNRYLHFGHDVTSAAKQANRLLMADADEFHELLQSNEMAYSTQV